MSSATEDRRLLAIGARLAAVTTIALMYALVKIADGRGVHIVESLFYRQLFAVPLVAIWVAVGPGFSSLKTDRPAAHGWRMAVGMCGMVLNFSTFILLPLAEATTIGFTVPMVTTILSALVLRESTGLHRWAAVILGFLGVLVVVQPGQSTLPAAGVAVGLCAALAVSCVNITLRQIGRTESATTTVFWFTVSSLIPVGIAMLFFARSHDGLTWLLLVLIGLTGGLAQLMLTTSLRWAPVSVVLPFDYLMLLWTAALGWLMFGDLPSHTTWLGAPLIIASGLYIAYREHKIHRERTAVTAPMD